MQQIKINIFFNFKVLIFQENRNYYLTKIDIYIKKIIPFGIILINIYNNHF